MAIRYQGIVTLKGYGQTNFAREWASPLVADNHIYESTPKTLLHRITTQKQCAAAPPPRKGRVQEGKGCAVFHDNIGFRSRLISLFAVETRMLNIGTVLPGRWDGKILTKWPFNPSIIQKFCARKLLVENFRVLRGFAKWLSFSRLWRIWRKMGIAGFKKSTPKKNLALTFYFLACLQNRERAPNRG